MKDAKETKKVIFYLAVIGSVIIVTAIIDIVMSVVNLSLLGYVIYCWKSDMSELRKRIPLSIVFASVFVLFTIALVDKIPVAITLGVTLCLLLLLKAPNWKSHFAATLIPAAVFIIGMEFYHKLLFGDDKATEGFLLSTILWAVGYMLPFSFYLLYFSKLKYLKPIDFKAIVIRSVKFSLFMAAFLGLYVGLLQDKFDSPMWLAVCFLLTPLFFALGYLFDLLLIERKKRPQKVNELEEFLREYESSKDRQSNETPDK